MLLSGTTMASANPAPATKPATAVKVPPIQAPEKRVDFQDLPRDHWAYDAINYLVESGVMEYGLNRPKADRLVTRYEFAITVARVINTQLNQSENWHQNIPEVVSQALNNIETASQKNGTPEPSNIKEKNIQVLTALCREFQGELTRMNFSRGDAHRQVSPRFRHFNSSLKRIPSVGRVPVAP